MSALGHKRSRDNVNQKYIWHLRLGHIEEDRIKILKKDGILYSLNSESYLISESCLQKKMIKLSFIGHEKKATEIPILVHIDVYRLFDV